MGKLKLGAMLRLGTFEASYLQTLQDIGMRESQLCRVSEKYLRGQEGLQNSEELIRSLQQKELPPTSIFVAAPGGVIEPKCRCQNMLNICRQLNWAERHGIKVAVCHVGELPENKGPEFEQFIADLQQLARLAEENQQQFLFETGSIDGDTLLEIFTAADSPALGLNLDPGNVLIYNLPESPLELYQKLGPWVKALHCKDAKRPQSGEERGRESVLGEGDSEFAALFQTILRDGFRGPIVIEREIPIGPEQFKDLKNALGLLQKLAEHN
ncbi:MAG: sugar phosphate isomerase/epimerase [Lentisphaeria bacterium]|nr:sugar phosphate isomerase/epimerase [Lentisphaeria bacterium]MDY0176425.1 sugar phosphate isomerase/epimerase family protein [Lentisphaeria bacterium]